MTDIITCKIIEQKKSAGFLDHAAIVGPARTFVISGVTDTQARKRIIDTVNQLNIPKNRLIATPSKENLLNIEIRFDDFYQDQQKWLNALRLQALTPEPQSFEKSRSFIGTVCTDAASETTTLQLTLVYQAVFNAIAALSVHTVCQKK